MTERAPRSRHPAASRLCEGLGRGEGLLTRRRDLPTPSLLSVPLAWLGVFFVAPIVIVALYSFNVYALLPGAHGFTLDAWRATGGNRIDADLDGFGNPSVSSQACTSLAGYIANSGDCDDADPLVNPTQTEIPGNGKDDDCDGVIDNNLADTGKACLVPASSSDYCKFCTDDDPQANTSGTPARVDARGIANHGTVSVVRCAATVRLFAEQDVAAGAQDVFCSRCGARLLSPFDSDAAAIRLLASIAWSLARVVKTTNTRT
jgi:hypothetical protein